MSDNVGSQGYAWRVLMRFSDLHTLIPTTANITGARLRLYLENWDDADSTPLMVRIPKRVCARSV